MAPHDSIAAMLASLLYMLLRRLLALVAPKHCTDDAAQIQILVLRHQATVSAVRPFGTTGYPIRSESWRLCIALAEMTSRWLAKEPAWKAS